MTQIQVTLNDHRFSDEFRGIEGIELTESRFVLEAKF